MGLAWIQTSASLPQPPTYWRCLIHYALDGDDDDDVDGDDDKENLKLRFAGSKTWTGTCDKRATACMQLVTSR